ncbi:DUF6236 family protein [Ornithinibacillus sp. 179-J 7C1 HS]|uniref:DUF6236 family protein n=1 Tax=Ornithinibacillus sp. 179-J 7C1 HS TaxID=3142384 RepID=UPI00399F4D09
MRRTILYYPNIEIPNNDWLRKSLLYWDEVSSIVPRSIENDLFANSSLISQLRDEGEFRAIYPDQLMLSEVYGDFEREVINKLKGYKRFIERNEIASRKILRSNSLDSFVHNEKISNRLNTILEQMDVFSSIGDWKSFDNQLANIYMATLAKYTALADANYTVIGTDQYDPINLMYPIKYATKRPLLNRTPIVNLSLNILPTPMSDVPIETIIRFKRRYREELLSFRKQVNQFEVEISNSESIEQIKEQLMLFKEKIEKETREAIRMLKGARINFFLSSIKSLLDVKSPTLMATLTAFAGDRFVNLPPTVSLAGVGIAGTVDFSINYMSLNRATKEKLSDKGFLYLYHAHKGKIVKDFI